MRPTVSVTVLHDYSHELRAVWPAEPAERLQQTYSQAETSQEARQQPEVAAQLHAAASAAADDASARPEAEGAAHRPGPGQAGAHATPARQRSRAQRQDRAAPRESQALQDRLRSISQPADSSTAADAQPLGATTVPDEQPVATSTAPDESAVRPPASQPLLSREEAIQALINLRPPIAPKVGCAGGGSCLLCCLCDRHWSRHEAPLLLGSYIAPCACCGHYVPDACSLGQGMRWFLIVSLAFTPYQRLAAERTQASFKPITRHQDLLLGAGFWALCSCCCRSRGLR